MLLVGGDSYGFENPDYPHWTRIISEGQDYENCSVRGRAIDFTSFATMQELIKGNYSHCIFCITHFNRVSIQIDTLTNADILRKVLSTLKYPDEIYEKDTLTKDSPFYTNYLQNPFNNEMIRNYLIKLLPEVKDMDDSELVFHNYGPKGFTFARDKTKHKKFLEMLPEFEFYHNNLSCLSLIKNYCGMHDIKLLFTCPLIDRTWREKIVDFLGIDFFDYEDVPGIYPQELIIRQDHQHRPSHFSKEEHEDIAKYFLEIRKDWFN